MNTFTEDLVLEPTKEFKPKWAAVDGRLFKVEDDRWVEVDPATLPDETTPAPAPSDTPR